MVNLALLGLAAFLTHCSGEPVTYEPLVNTRFQESYFWGDSMSCYNYIRYSPITYFIRSFYHAVFQTQVDLDTAAYDSQVLPSEIYCLLWIQRAGDFGSLLDYSSLLNMQPAINGTASILVHTEDYELFWAASYRCVNERPYVFMEIKEFNLDFRYFNVPPLLIQYLSKTTDLYCSARIY